MTTAEVLENAIGDWTSDKKINALCAWIDAGCDPLHNTITNLQDFLKQHKKQQTPDWADWGRMEFTSSKVEKEFRDRVFAALKENGVLEAAVEYSGGGDDGSYENPRVTSGVPVDLTQVRIPLLSSYEVDFVKSNGSKTEIQEGIIIPGEIRNGITIGQLRGSVVSLSTAIRTLCEAWGDEQHSGWWNCAGASGTFTFYVPDGYVIWQHGTYTEEQDWTEYKL
jgi:hypothetical protein